jgi:hypothetical protein
MLAVGWVPKRGVSFYLRQTVNKIAQSNRVFICYLGGIIK